MIHPSISLLLLLLLLTHHLPTSLSTTTFTLTNQCPFTIWPAALSNAGHPPLPTTTFLLPPNSSLSLHSPPNWSGRFWARTACAPNSSCLTGDTPPATLAEFSLGANNQQKLDFYDVSLVDGYNLPMAVEGGNGRCAATGCLVDLNQRCPLELRVGAAETVACRSACDVFRRPEYCCSGEFASAATCKPTVYSEVFKTACPKSYSYAFDDSSSTFTCVDAGEFTVTFCPEGSQSQKAPKGPSITPKASPTSPKTPEGGGLMLEDDAWLSSFVDGSAASQTVKINSSSFMLFVVLCSISILFILSSSRYY